MVRTIQKGLTDAVHSVEKGVLAARVIAGEEKATLDTRLFKTREAAYNAAYLAEIKDDPGVTPLWIQKYGPETVRSLSTVLAAGPAAIPAFVVTTMSDAIVEAKAQGLSEDEMWRFAIVNGVAEGGIASAFSAAGLGGLEKSFTRRQIMHIGTKSIAKSFGIQTASEVTEELITEFIQNWNQSVAFDTPQTGEEFRESMKATVITTLLTMGASGGGLSISQARQIKKVQEQIRSMDESGRNEMVDGILNDVMSDAMANPYDAKDTQIQPLSDSDRAKLNKLAEKETLSRKDMTDLGIKERTTAKERASIHEDIKKQAKEQVGEDIKVDDMTPEQALVAFKDGNDDAGRLIIQEHQKGNEAFEEVFKQVQHVDIEVTAAPDIVEAPKVTTEKAKVRPTSVAKLSREVEKAHSDFFGTTVKEESEAAAEGVLSQESEDFGEFKTQFSGPIPTEIKEALAGRADLLLKLKGNTEGGLGEDVLRDIGVEEYVERLTTIFKGKKARLDQSIERMLEVTKGT
ncbi:hypothetical protein KAR91_06525, partial [Candidatus Pacearchaeota archaeon]|nr:hypothetical protein [Candidatus Pacearchaeota archaeon]